MNIFDILNKIGIELSGWIKENWIYMASGALLIAVGILIGYECAWTEFKDVLNETVGG